MGLTLLESTERYLSKTTKEGKLALSSAKEYRGKYRMYARELGGWERQLDTISPYEWEEACDELWGGRSGKTYNLSRTAALSFLAYATEVGKWCSFEKPSTWRTHSFDKERDLALSRSFVSDITTSPNYPLRERLLWSLLYQSSERVSAVLSIDVPSLESRSKIARVKIKGGDTRLIHWQPSGAELIREYLDGRTTGPLFLTDKMPWNWRERDESDRDGRLYRLDYKTARYHFHKWTGLSRLHRIRHSRLTHLAEDGTSTPMLKAVSGHKSVASLAHYSQPSSEAVSAFMEAQENRKSPDAG